jgi:aquaporin Z
MRGYVNLVTQVKSKEKLMSSQEVSHNEKRTSVLTPLASLELTRRNFDDPALEWRRLFSELLGTFLLVLVGAGGGVVNAVSNGAISRAAGVTAPGLMVLAIILFMGAISGAHLNPAVSIAFAVRGNFPWLRVPGYIIAQLVGSM